MQLFVPFHSTEVIAVEQPVDLLPRQRNQLLFTTRPVELLLGQALVIEHEPVVFPIQELDLVPPPVGEGIQRPFERVVAQLLFDDGSQAPEALAEIDRITIQVDPRHPWMRAQPVRHHSTASSCFTTGRFCTSIPRISRPLGRLKVRPVGCTAPGITGTKPDGLSRAVGSATRRSLRTQ